MTNEMRTYEQAQMAAQKRAIFEGLIEALALGGQTPMRITAAAILFDRESADGEEMPGLLSFDEEGASLSEDVTIAMLTAGTVALSFRRLPPWSGQAGEEDGEA
ncbi:MAG: hypothetical protein QOE83_340 [Actinomycetota bacterium]|jgi:hypothetical protein|nr:hypothetical protein [Actinomycetota bacterium]